MKYTERKIKMDYEKIMKIARRVNQNRSKIDRKNGFAAVEDVSNLMQIETAMEAIKCGIITNDWDCVAEGQAMLESLVTTLVTEMRKLQDGRY